MKMTTNHVETKQNFAFDEVTEMGIHGTATAHLLGILIKQYSNPYMAALREYTSNALDAHTESGQTRPIEVSTPNELSPVLVIRDYGLGLDREEIKLFGQFGHSTKRDTNDSIGGFGLGSKSALAMAPQFTVQSIKNGRMNTIVITRNDMGAPEMGFLEEVSTTEPSGTKIMIPTTRFDVYKNAKFSPTFWAGWKPGTILIDGEVPQGAGKLFNTDQFIEIGDGIGWMEKDFTKTSYSAFTTQRRGYDGRMVNSIIAGVHYEIPIEKLDLPENHPIYDYREELLSTIILNVENGAVTIHPSRETLTYDKVTREYLTERITEAVKAPITALRENVKRVSTFQEAYEVWYDIRSNYDANFKLTFRGYAFGDRNAHQENTRKKYFEKFKWVGYTKFYMDSYSTRMLSQEMSFREEIMGRTIESWNMNRRSTDILIVGAPRTQDDRLFHLNYKRHDSFMRPTNKDQKAINTESRRMSFYAPARPEIRKMLTTGNIVDRNPNVYVVSLPMEEIPAWFLATFRKVIRFEDVVRHNEAQDKKLREKARESRVALVEASDGVIKDVDSTRVPTIRRITGVTSTTSNYRIGDVFTVKLQTILEQSKSETQKTYNFITEADSPMGIALMTTKNREVIKPYLNSLVILSGRHTPSVQINLLIVSSRGIYSLTEEERKSIPNQYTDMGQMIKDIVAEIAGSIESQEVWEFLGRRNSQFDVKDYEWSYFLGQEQIDLIEDQELAEGIKAYKKTLKSVNQLREITYKTDAERQAANLFHTYGDSLGIEEIVREKLGTLAEYLDPVSRYPMLGFVSSWNRPREAEHFEKLIDYFNLVYSAGIDNEASA